MAIRRRVDRGMLALLPPVLVYSAFGAARVDAPVGLIGLVFDEPLAFVLVSTVVALGGAVLLFVPTIERRLAGVLVPSREPRPDEAARIGAALERVGAHAGSDPRRLIVRIQDADDLNAAAGAAHLLFVTRGAFACGDRAFDALIAHELGHHRGLHPVGAAIVLWLSLPGLALAAVFSALRRLARLLAGRVPPLALAVQLLLLLWQLLVMWIYYVGELLAAWTSRVTEYAADATAASWGYGPDLRELYASMGEPPPAGRLERLTATHPPMTRRIARLEARPAALAQPA
jgi:Zn-dependent protease with chaperone function